FGWLSDKIGRKPIIMAGCLIAALTYFPLFKALTHFANPALEQALSSSPVTVIADPKECSFQFNPVGTAKFTSSCDIAKSFLARNSVSYDTVAAPPGTSAVVKIVEQEIPSIDGRLLDPESLKTRSAEVNDRLSAAIRAHGYPAK